MHALRHGNVCCVCVCVCVCYVLGAGQDGRGFHHGQAVEADGEGVERERYQTQDPGEEGPHHHPWFTLATF